MSWDFKEFRDEDVRERLLRGVLGTPIDFLELRSFPAFESRGFAGDLAGKLRDSKMSIRGLLSEGLKILWVFLSVVDFVAYVYRYSPSTIPLLSLNPLQTFRPTSFYIELLSFVHSLSPLIHQSLIWQRLKETNKEDANMSSFNFTTVESAWKSWSGRESDNLKTRQGKFEITCIW